MAGQPISGGRRDPIAVRLLVMDVDGVLTDGSIYLDDHGVETKRFNVRDGQGITAWLGLGLDAAVVTRRSGLAVQHRMRELGVTRVMQGEMDKSAALDELLSQTGLGADEVAYVADDWPDLPVMRRVGFPVAVADADPRVRALAAYVTTNPGGRGAVREAIEHILSAKGLLEEALGKFA